jgi:hypothetical protein
VTGAGRKRLERRAKRGDAGDGERAKRRAVVGGLARDDLGALRLAVLLVECADQLPRGLDRLGAARREEDAVEVARRELRDACGELDGRRMGVGPVREELEVTRLVGARLGHLMPPMPDVDAEKRRKAVEVLVAVLVPDVAAIPADDDRHLVLVVVGAHAAEVHPQMAASLLLEGAGGLRCVLGRRHRYSNPRIRCTSWTRVGGGVGGWQGPPGSAAASVLYDSALPGS